MLAFIGNNLPTILVGAVILALIGLALWSMRRSKKKGSGCCGSCAGCPHAGNCKKTDP